MNHTDATQTEQLDCITCGQPVDPTKNYNLDQHAACADQD
jgi:hypothetical protein